MMKLENVCISSLKNFHQVLKRKKRLKESIISGERKNVKVFYITHAI